MHWNPFVVRKNSVSNVLPAPKWTPPPPMRVEASVEPDDRVDGQRINGRAL